MAFELNFETLKKKSLKYTPDEIFKIDFLVDVSNLQNILSATANSTIKAFEQVEKNIDVTIRIISTIVFITKENKFETVSATIDKNVRLENVEGAPYFIKSSVLNVVVDNIENEQVKIYADVSMQPVLIETEELKVLCNNENLTAKSESLDYLVLDSLNQEHFNLVEEIDFKGDKILSVNAVTKSAKIVCSKDIYIVDGEVTASLLIDKNGEMVSEDRRFVFRQELSMLGSLETTVPNVCLEIGSVTFSSENVSDEGAEIRKATIIFGINSFMEGYCNQKATFVTDCYSTSNELLLSSEGSSFVTSLKELSETKNLKVLATIKDKLVNVENVKSCSDPRVKIFTIKENGTKTVISGAFEFNLIYSGDDEKQNSIEISTAFEEELDVNFSTINQIKPTLRIEKVTKRKPREFEIEYNVSYFVSYNESKFISFISAVEIGEGKSANDYAITVIYNNEKLDEFNKCKLLNVNVDEFNKQNSSEEEVSVIYRPVNIDF